MIARGRGPECPAQLNTFRTKTHEDNSIRFLLQHCGVCEVRLSFSTLDWRDATEYLLQRLQ